MSTSSSMLLLHAAVISLGLQLGLQLWQLAKRPRSSTPWRARLACVWATLVLGLVLGLCLRQAYGLLEDSAARGWANVAHVLYGLTELLPQLLGNVALALTLWSLVLGSVALPNVQAPRRKWLVLGVLTWLVTGPGLFVWCLRDHLQQLAALDALTTSQRLEALPDDTALARAAGVAVAGLFAAAALLFLALRPSSAPSPGRHHGTERDAVGRWSWRFGFEVLCALGLLAATVVCWRIGTRLQWEAEHPLDPTMAFANCGFCIPDRPGPRGEGPDELVEAPHVVFSQQGVTIDGSPVAYPGELKDALAAKRDLYGQLNPGKPSPRRVVFNMGNVSEVAALLEPLTQTVDAGFDGVYFLFSELRQEDRPVLGTLWGRRDTALAVRVARSRERCAELDAQVVPVALVAERNLSRWLGTLVDDKARAGAKTPCLLLPPPECSPDGRVCTHPSAHGFGVTEQRAIAEGVDALRAERGNEEYLVAFVPFSRALRTTLMGQRPDSLQSFVQLDTRLQQQGQQLVWAMNAGMYHPDRAPVGLYVRDQKTEYPLNTKRGEGNFFLQPNGVFVLTQQRIPLVLPTHDYGSLVQELGQPWLATQSGPLLVSGGKLARSFDPASDSRFIRNGVGVHDEYTTVLLISTKPVTFHEFAKAFLDFGCRDALYLDGSVSSLFAPKFGRRDSGRGLGPIIYLTAPTSEATAQ